MESKNKQAGMPSDEEISAFARAKYPITFMDEGQAICDKENFQDAVICGAKWVRDNFMSQPPKSEAEEATNEMIQWAFTQGKISLKDALNHARADERNKFCPPNVPEHRDESEVEEDKKMLSMVINMAYLGLGDIRKKISNQELEERLSAIKNIESSLLSAPSKWKYSEWISVDDRLPEMDTEFFVLQAGRPQVKIRGHHCFGSYTDFSENEFYNKITHWMPLPAAPESSNPQK